MVSAISAVNVVNEPSLEAQVAEHSVIQIKELSLALDLESVPISSPPLSEKREETAATLTTGPRKQRLLLRSSDPKRKFLPGQPRVSLDPADDGAYDDAAQDKDPNSYRLKDYLRRAHLTTELDKLLPFMKYIFVQTPSHRHIMPLHHQQAHGREKIIVDELPGLHLIWYYDRIYVKPIPAYMYSQHFWDFIHNADPEVYMACLGFMRSYYHLIKYEIDYDRACELKLVPKIPPATCLQEPRLPTYEEFCAFIMPFGDPREVSDNMVCRRFRYGELRLSRINKTTMLVRRKFAYFHIYPQWGSYLSHIIAPVVTVFAFLSVIFNALQVTLAALEVGYESVSQSWYPFLDVAVWFPVIVMFFIAFLLAAGIFGVLVMGLKDLIWAKTVRQRRKQGDPNAGEKAYGIIW